MPLFRESKKSKKPEEDDFCHVKPYKEGLGTKFVFAHKEKIISKFATFDLKPIGRGASGSSVHQAIEHDGEVVAVKVIGCRYESTKSRQLWAARVKREVDLLQSIQHENIVTVYNPEWMCLSKGWGSSSTPNCLLLKTELLGPNLAEVLRKTGKPMSVTVASRVVTQIGSALAYMHQELKMVHHDLEPKNIVLTKQLDYTGDVEAQLREADFKLIDFGVAKQYPNDELAKATRVHRLGGNKFFQSPEKLGLVDDCPSYNAYLADIYSLGMTVMCLLMGTEEFGRLWRHANVCSKSNPIRGMVKQYFYLMDGQMQPIHILVRLMITKEESRIRTETLASMLNDL